MLWGVRNTLWMLFAAVALLLLLVLFNVGNLLVTRHANRLREYAIQQALGGSRWQMFRQALIQQTILIAIASILSLILSRWTIEMVRTMGAGRVPRLYELSLDTHTVLLLAALAAATALIFGTLPIIILPDSTDSFRTESRPSTGDRRSQRVRSALIAAEIEVSMVLLVTAGLIAASFLKVLNVDPGFDPKNLLTFNVSFSPVLPNTAHPADRRPPSSRGRFRKGRRRQSQHGPSAMASERPDWPRVHRQRRATHSGHWNRG